MFRRSLAALVSFSFLAACNPALPVIREGGTSSSATPRAPLGPTWDGEELRVGVFSARATRIELWIYASPVGTSEQSRHEMTRDEAGRWSVAIAASDLPAGTIHYGLRAWGPNWTFAPAWTPGSSAGFLSDVDGAGNRFNPNKLLLDPYAPEMSHDPITSTFTSGAIYASGPDHRAKDSAPFAPKAIALRPESSNIGVKPSRPLKDEVIYEVHLRGFTKNDPSIPTNLRGTFAGAALKADYLRDIGVTAVEFLPLQETQNDQNDLLASTEGDNYWGYMTLSYFAPERRYAADRTPGGPTRELQQMVKAFHDRGIKVYVDVVYNHTGEGGLWDGTGNTANLLSWRGLDNASYYELDGSKRYYYDNTGCGGNFNAANEAARDLVVDSLGYWKDVLGVDGFRFDLASVLGNRCENGCFEFDKMDPASSLNRLVNELPVRPAMGGDGADLIAEPWAIGGGTYQVGNFPSGWAEWNGIYRDTFRKDQNQMGFEAVTPADLARRFAGSSDLFQDDGRKPWHSVNFLVAHDGFTMRDLYAYNGKNNNQAWPYGPSDGGEDTNRSWDQGGDASLQRQAARNGIAILALSAGVPMVTGGDEMYRTQYGNNNAYNLDSGKNWLDWNDASANAGFLDFSRRILRFRNAHPALRPAEFFRGTDGNGNGLKDITWLRDDGVEASVSYMSDAGRHFLAYRLDGTEAGDSAHSIYVAYNGWAGTVTATLPAPAAGKSWYRVADTASWMESMGNSKDPGLEDKLTGTTYDLAGRSLLLLVER